MAIYTKRGDKGETSLYDPANAQNIRVSKDSARINAIGNLDELNAFFGVISSKTEGDLSKKIEELQLNIFTINSILAGAKLPFPASKTTGLEKEIDKMEGSLPVLANFILMGGTEIGSLIHYARTLVRRGERALVTLNELEPVNPEIMKYINRLSDYMFMLARKVNQESETPEKVWRRK